jgi:myosin-1
MTANNKLAGNKERRRMSLSRPFKGDYIGYRENFELKDIVERNGREKLGLGDRINKYDRRGNPQRRILLLTDQAIYIVSIDKNMDKDKVARAKKPWIYNLKRRLPLNTIRGITLSTCADNFFAIHVPGDYDSLVESRRKTEFIGTLLKYNPSVNISFSDRFESFCFFSFFFFSFLFVF